MGWIYVEAVPDINYPIVHGKDNETYLHRTYEKNYNFAGTIFVDYENKGDFSDCNTIVYGHNMKNGSMFAQLKKFTQDEETYKKSKYFWIFTPEKNYRYEIISAYTTGVTVIPIHCLRDLVRNLKNIWRRSEDIPRSGQMQKE